jgi:hypothetical protein
MRWKGASIVLKAGRPMSQKIWLVVRRSVIAAAAVAAVVVVSSCGIMDWVIGNNIDVNGAAATLTQEHTAVGGTKVSQVFLGNQNDFDKVNIVSALTGGQTCYRPSINLYGVFPEDADANHQCVAWAFDCFYRYPEGTCPNPPDVRVYPSASPSAASTPSPLLLTRLFSADVKENPKFTLTSDAEALRLRRNAVQERLVAASNSACRDFTQHLNTYQSYTNFLLGTAAVGTGAAGAIVAGATAARALAGVTGAISGTRAEFNSDLFAQKVVATIVQAIDESRADYLIVLRGKTIEGNNRALLNSRNVPSGGAPAPDTGTAGAGSGAPANPKPTPIPNENLSDVSKQSLSIIDYPVEAAIADAIYYNDLCSLDKGLETLTQSLSTANHPGLDETLEAVKKVDEIRKVAQGGSFAEPSPSAAPSPSTTSGSVTAGFVGTAAGATTIFNTTTVGDTSPSINLTIANSAKNKPLNITSFSVPAPYQVPVGMSTSFSLSPKGNSKAPSTGSTITIPVTFSPTIPGPLPATIVIDSSDPSVPRKMIFVTGTGTAAK